MDHVLEVTKKVLKLLRVKYTNQYVKDTLLSHPEYPSLLAISNTLDKYHIENIAIKVDAEKLKDLPLPCIVQMTMQRTTVFCVLKSFSEDGVIYIDPTNKTVTTTKDDFLKNWTGICLLVEKLEHSKEPGLEERLRSKRVLHVFKGALLTFLLAWIALSFYKSPIIGEAAPMMIYSLVYMALKITGLIVGTLLLWFEVDQYNPTLQSFCSGGKKVNCNTVLSSKYAWLFHKNLSISLIGFSYFFGTLAYMIIHEFSVASTALLSFFSLMALPAIIGSAYYQAVILKQWCKFCMVLQGVLAMEISVVFLAGFYQYGIALEALPLLFVLMLAPILGWMFIKPLLEQGKKTHLYHRGLQKIKNNPDVLSGLLTKTRGIVNSTQGLGISLKNPHAKYEVVKVCNPYCGPCAKAHPVLEELVNQGMINLQILFTTTPNPKDRAAKPVSHLLAIAAQGNDHNTQTALDDWYNTEQKDYEYFAKKYPMNGELEQQYDKIKAMRDWCNAEKITHTPTLFINGHELPKEYNVADLKEVLAQ